MHKQKSQEIEHKSPNGYTIKVRGYNHSFIIFKPDGNPERLDTKDPNRIINHLKTVVFIGPQFSLRESYSGIAFFPVKKGRIVVPYYHSQLQSEKAILIHTPSTSDLYPLITEKIANLDELYHNLRAGHIPHYVVLDESVSRQELISLKQRLPSAYLFTIKMHDSSNKLHKSGKTTPTRQQLLGEKLDQSKVRATDLLEEDKKNVDIYSDNPVFMARVFLRNLELGKIKSLLLEKPITIQENMYIQTFLDTMITNEYDKKELADSKGELVRLKKYFELQMVILQEEYDALETMITEETDKNDLTFYSYSLKRYKEGAQDRDKQIKFWELEGAIKSRIQELTKQTTG